MHKLPIRRSGAPAIYRISGWHHALFMPRRGRISKKIAATSYRVSINKNGSELRPTKRRSVPVFRPRMDLRGGWFRPGIPADRARPPASAGRVGHPGPKTSKVGRL
jgi:hypothetical protein